MMASEIHLLEGAFGWSPERTLDGLEDFLSSDAGRFSESVAHPNPKGRLPAPLVISFPLPLTDS